MANVTVSQQPVYGLAVGGRRSTSPFRAKILSYAPLNFWQFDDLAGSSYALDVGSSPRNFTPTSVTLGASPIAAGEQRSMQFASGQYVRNPSNYVYPSVFTTGVLVSFTSYGGGNNDCCLLGAWAGPGSMLSCSLSGSVISMYMNTTHCDFVYDLRGQGRKFVCGTFDGSFLRLYLDGVLVGGPTAASASTPNRPMGINIYSDSANTAAGKVSDAFVIPSVLTDAQIRQLQSLLG